MHIKKTVEAICEGVNGAQSKVNACKILFDVMHEPEAQEKLKALIEGAATDLEAAFNAIVGDAD